MSRSVKLALDVLLGAIVPILVLSYLSEPLGAVPTYLLSALVPVGWMVVDLFFVTKRLNFITASWASTPSCGGSWPSGSSTGYSSRSRTPPAAR